MLGNYKVSTNGNTSEGETEKQLLRLKHLVEKTSIYSKFLYERMKEQQEIKVKEKLRTQNRLTKKLKLESSKIKLTPEKCQSLASSAKVSMFRTKEKGDDSVVLKKTSQSIKKPSNKYTIADYLTEADFDLTLKDSSDFASEAESVDSYSRIINGQRASDRQPELVTGGVLRDYQLVGLEWLISLYENGLNGVLGDEMGLGKTLQCISFLAHLIEKGVHGPFLICAPTSTVGNWAAEFSNYTPAVPVVIYHGTPQERKAIRRNVLNMRNFATLAGKRGVVRNNGKQLDIMPVIITTYEMVMRDHRAFQGIQWHYIIVDEGHRLKNLHCKLIKELKSCPSSNRLLLTGTPLQNSLSELWSLLNFLLPDIFDDLDAFQSWFDFDLQEEGRQLFLEEDTEKWLLSQLHKILEPFLLRRLKQDVEQALPLKRELIVYTPMSDLQKQMYTTSLLGKFREYVEERDRKDSCTNQRLSPLGDAALEDRRNHVKPESDEGPIKSSWRNIKLQNLLVHLRKICNHPYLVEYPLDHHGNYLVDDDLVKASGKLVMLDRLLPALQHRGHRLLLFSQMTRMLDILQDYCSLRSYKYSRLDGSLAQKERERVISEFNEDASIFIFLLSTRAGGMGINLTSADTVLIYDSDWNPQCDLQAQDRCHRIGQKKPVLVYRFVTDKSVEITLLNRAQAKRRLEKAVFHKAKFKGKCLDEATEPLTAEELSTLIEETGHVRVISSVDDVISNRELELLLDRSEGSNCKYA